jgi:assimilatory nitrate reductase catalytic subunit
VNEIKTTCPYCGVGCGVLATTDGTQIVSVRGDPDHPANFGKLCSKGSALARTVGAGGRLTAPQVRQTRDATRTEATWDDALAQVTDTFARIIEKHGPDAVAFYGSGQLLTEDYYALNKLARAVIRTNNIDTNSRLCMSSAVAGYKATLGADAVPTCYDDIDHADLLFIAGSNTAWAHPIVFRRIEAARALRPTQKIIVVDPRRTETAAQADLHLANLPGTDVALFHAALANLGRARKSRLHRRSHRRLCYVENTRARALARCCCAHLRRTRERHYYRCPLVGGIRERALTILPRLESKHKRHG